jgi:hypothetical protein
MDMGKLSHLQTPTDRVSSSAPPPVTGARYVVALRPLSGLRLNCESAPWFCRLLSIRKERGSVGEGSD